jgi:hypothetical protein
LGYHVGLLGLVENQLGVDFGGGSGMSPLTMPGPAINEDLKFLLATTLKNAWC